MNFINYRLRKTWLEKFIKNPVPAQPSTVNMLKGLKHL